MRTQGDDCAYRAEVERLRIEREMLADEYELALEELELELEEEEEEEEDDDDEDFEFFLLCAAAAAYYAERERRDRRRRRLLLEEEYILALMSSDGPLRSPRDPAPRFVWEEHVANLRRNEDTMGRGHDAFRKRYRMTQLAFNNLLNLLAPRLRKNTTMSRNAPGGHPVVLEVGKDKACSLPRQPACKHTSCSPQVRLAVALRVFAGASTNELHLIYNLGESTVWRIVRQVIDAINGTAALDFVFPGKDDRAKLDEIAAGFANKSQGRLFDKCIGAVDGVHFKTLSNGKSTRNYVHREGYSAILAQAICNAKREFTFVSIKKEARTHDSTAWECSDLGASFKSGDYSADGYYLVGDNAYVLANNMIVPTGKRRHITQRPSFLSASFTLMENFALVRSLLCAAFQTGRTPTLISFTAKFVSTSSAPLECSLRDGDCYGPRCSVARVLAQPL